WFAHQAVVFHPRGIAGEVALDRFVGPLVHHFQHVRPRGARLQAQRVADEIALLAAGVRGVQELVAEVAQRIGRVQLANLRGEVAHPATSRTGCGASARGGCTCPQLRHVRFSSEPWNRPNPGGKSRSMSCSWKNSSYSLWLQRSQYHSRPSRSCGRRTRSITRPTPPAMRCGECGTRGGSRKVSPARIGISRSEPGPPSGRSCTRSTISPSSW